MRKLIQRGLSGEANPLHLVLFRIGFGLFMALQMYRYIRMDLVGNMFVKPKYNFKYDGFYWLDRLPEEGMRALLVVLMLLALAIAAGLWMKWSAWAFSVLYAYLFLLDKSLFNNHIYMFILVAVLLSFTSADQWWSVRSWRSGAPPWRVPVWQYRILQAQIVIVYFYGGLAKLTYDWIFLQQPARTLIQQISPDSFLGPALNNELGVHLLNWGGLFLDLLAPLLLWHPGIRRYAVFLFIGFNAANSQIFGDIGLFPYIMLFNLILFFKPEEIPGWRNLARRRGWLSMPKGALAPDATLGLSGMTPGVRTALAGYFVIQLLAPFRGHFLPNQLDWTTIGNRFSWRMKVDTRKPEKLNFWILEPSISPDPAPVDINTFINTVQIRMLYTDPRCVADFAAFLKREAAQYGGANARVTAEIEVSYGGRKPQSFVDPTVDLATASYSVFRKIPWVYPLQR